MKRWTQWLVAAALLLSLAHPGLAQEHAFAQAEEVFHHLLESHVSKPEESRLVQGALRYVSEVAKQEQKRDLYVSPDDDTMWELWTRLRQWKRQFGWEESWLNSLVIEGMLQSLDDPHTQFFTEKELMLFQADVENRFVGFGFRLRLQDGSFLIREIVAHSPAAASGLKKGDRILAVDGQSLLGMDFEQAYGYLRGGEGSEAVLKVYRASENREIEVRLKRVAMSLPEAVGQLFDGGKIGYIRLETFGSDAAPQMKEILASFRHSGKPLAGLILDVRDNGGGYLSAARDIASLFMEEGILMYMTNRNGVEVATWVRNGDDISVPVRILVNHGSASASELLSGALRDNGIAQLVGSQTYGKGSAQQVIPLSGGDVLKLTLNEYFTPQHTVVNHVGLEPDIIVEDDAAQVVGALRSLGVTSWEIRDQDGDTVINGIAFPTLHPLWKQGEGGGLEVRAAVLAQLLGEDELELLEYVQLAPYLEKNESLRLVEKNGEYVLTYSQPS